MLRRIHLDRALVFSYIMRGPDHAVEERSPTSDSSLHSLSPLMIQAPSIDKAFAYQRFTTASMITLANPLRSSSRSK